MSAHDLDELEGDSASATVELSVSTSMLLGFELSTSWSREWLHEYDRFNWGISLSGK